MSAILREAAQALAKDWTLKGLHPPFRPDDVEEVAERGVYVRCARLLNDALALPDAPRGGWEEGAEAMREAAARACDDVETGLRSSRGVCGLSDLDYGQVCGAQKCEERIRALPLPSAPTQVPEAGFLLSNGGGLVKAEPFDPGTPCPCGAPSYQWHKSTPLCTHMQTTKPAPEAKTAESAIGYIARPVGSRRLDCDVYLSEREAEDRVKRDPAGLPAYEIVRVRITVEPAPVEPEETP